MNLRTPPASCSLSLCRQAPTSTGHDEMTARWCGAARVRRGCSRRDQSDASSPPALQAAGCATASASMTGTRGPSVTASGYKRSRWSGRQPTPRCWTPAARSTRWVTVATSSSARSWRYSRPARGLPLRRRVRTHRRARAHDLGDQDPYGGPGIGRRATALIPDARLEVMPGAPRPFLDDPRRCGALIDQLLRRVPAPADRSQSDEAHAARPSAEGFWRARGRQDARQTGSTGERTPTSARGARVVAAAVWQNENDKRTPGESTFRPLVWPRRSHSVRKAPGPGISRWPGTEHRRQLLLASKESSVRRAGTLGGPPRQPGR
jgi:hypothetical protein